MQNLNFLYEKLEVLDSIDIPLFIDEMTEEDEPKTYVLVERFNSESPFSYGDGNSLVKQVQFTIRIFSNSVSKIIEIYQSYSLKLKEHEIKHTYYGPVMDFDRSYSAQIVGRYQYAE